MVEMLRLCALAAVAIWLMRPYMTDRLVGSGDSLWYASALGDFTQQTRAGVFPVLVGQSDWAFNGAVSPVRIIPLYQHLGGVLDLLTGGRLGPFALQNLCLVTCGFGAIFTAYFSLTAIAPKLRWPAAALATLFVSCPGVLGTLYSQDLLATWVAVPLVPVATSALCQTMRGGGLRSHLLLGSSLATLWWAHTPIALWLTGVAGIMRVGNIICHQRTRGEWTGITCCLGIFVLLVAYPMVSALSLTHTGKLDAPILGSFSLADLLATIRGSFPGSVLPVSRRAVVPLSDLQLGYSLAFVWLACLIYSATKLVGRSLDYALGALMIACALIYSLLLPIPFWTSAVWRLVPKPVLVITNQWPMQRLYVILAGLLIVAAQLAIGSLRDMTRRTIAVGGVFTFAVCLWSLWQAREFLEEGRTRTATAANSALAARPENRVIGAYAYGALGRIPAYYSNGVMDPASENRLLGPDDVPQRSHSASPLMEGEFTGHRDSNPGILDLSPRLHLDPGSHYTLEFEFRNPKLAGILQIVGRSLFREYSLPRSGERLAFGSGPEQSHVLPLWTTEPHGDDVELRFIPQGGVPSSMERAGFSRFRLLRQDRKEPIELIGLIPLRLRVTSSTPAWLETSRMFIPGYDALVDGKRVPVRPSKEGLVTVPVGPGAKMVVIRYLGPFWLRASYWVSLTAFIGLAVYLIRGGKTYPP